MLRFEIQIREMERDLKNTQTMNQNFTFEKTQLLQRIDNLEEKLESEKTAKVGEQNPSKQEQQLQRRRLTLAIDPTE